MSGSRANVVLLDLDGTLTDPRLGIVRCVRHALDHFGVACPDDDVLAACIGPPLRKSFARFLETSDAERVEEAMRVFRERYSTVGLFENEVYPAIPEAIAELARRADALFVATSKPAVFATRIVERFGLASHFERVYGSELDGRFDDKADLLGHIVAEEGLAPQTTTMVGDRDVDILAARTHGIRSVGVCWGFGSIEELVGAGADLLCERATTLPDILDSAW